MDGTIRYTDHTTSLTIWLRVIYIPNGGAEKELGHLVLETSAYYESIQRTCLPELFMLSGDVLDFRTMDFSTDGTVQYNMNYKATEFGA